MRLSELIAQSRVVADSVTANRWTDGQVAAYVNSHQQSVVRKTAQVNQGYHNHTFQIAASAGRKKHADVVSYRLPRWVMKVQAVRRGSTTPSESNRDLVIPRSDQVNRRGGWEWSANNEFQLLGYSAAIDLELDVAKRPANLTKGTLPTQGAALDGLTLDNDTSADALIYPHETQLNSYAGGLFEITGPASARKGQLLRCVSSLHNQGGSNVSVVLTMEEPWSVLPAAADTYEMHAELGDEHCRLIVLLTGRSMLAQERNVQGIAAISRELEEQWSLYVQHIAERDNAGPHFVVMDGGTPALDSPFFATEFY